MPTAQRTITINRPPGEVFAFIAVGENNPRWRPRFIEVTRRSGDGSVGTAYQAAEKGPFGRRLAGDFRVSEYVPPSRYAYEVTTGPARPRGAFELAAAPGGATNLTFTLAWKPTGLARLITPFVARGFKHEMQSLDLLRRELEAGGSPPTPVKTAGPPQGALATPDETRPAAVVRPTVASQGGAPARVTVVSGPDAGETREFATELVVGREGAGLELTDPEVSRRHVRLVVQAEGVIVEDLGSTNGTQVDGSPITAPHALSLVGVVSVGTSELRVEPRAAAAATRPHRVVPDVTRQRPVIPEP